MIKIAREDLLNHFRSLEPGLSPLGLIEGSNCFMFKDGYVFTYNEEIACYSKSQVGDFTGAVRAEPLLKILDKMTQDVVGVEVTEKELVIKAKGKEEVAVTLEKELGVDYSRVVEHPESWRNLHEDFHDAIVIVSECTSDDLGKFELKFLVHVHPEWLEACDNYQGTRYILPTGFSEPILVKSGSIKHVVTLGMTECAETETWIHFRNSGGSVLSCRRYLEAYKDFTRYYKIEGEPLTLPKGLDETADKANIFSNEHADFNLVTVSLSPGKLLVESRGITGRYKKQKEVTYEGPTFSFKASPELLMQISKNYKDVRVSPTRLMVDGGKFVFFSQLIKPEDLELKEVEKPRRGKKEDE